MTINPIPALRTWNKAQRIARLILRIQRAYIGREVIELLPNGKQITATVVKMEWENSIGLEGDWCVYIQYQDGTKTWVGCDALMLVEVQ